MDFETIEKEQKEEIKQAIKNNRLFDYISSNYWRLINNDMIIQLLKECIYTMDLDNTETQNKLIENLNDFEGWND